MSEVENFLSDEEILERVAVFRTEDFPPDCIEYAEVLAKECSGKVTEDAIGILVEKFPDDRLSELVRKHVVPSLGPGVDHCQGSHSGPLAIALIGRGFEVHSGWRVTWPDGEVLEGDNLCRLALRAVWLRRMRSRGSGSPPAF